LQQSDGELQSRRVDAVAAVLAKGRPRKAAALVFDIFIGRAGNECDSMKQCVRLYAAAWWLTDHPTHLFSLCPRNQFRSSQGCVSSRNGQFNAEFFHQAGGRFIYFTSCLTSGIIFAVSAAPASYNSHTKLDYLM
jgi:hypothetical protein